MLRSVAITGWGHYLPASILTNEQLAFRVHTSDEWIRTRTGIRERRIAAPAETTSSLCIEASRLALARAELAAEDVDLVICATTTPDCLVPATACLVQHGLGANRAGAFDLNAACTGFLYALTVGAQFIRAGTSQRVLVVGGEIWSRFVDWNDRSTCILLGDGAGAVILEAATQEGGVLSTVLGSQGDADHLLAIEAGGSARPASLESVAAGAHYLRMRGSEVFRQAVRSMGQAAHEALRQVDLTPAQLHKVIAHQANARILQAVQQSLGLPWDRFHINLDRYGNTGAASIPIALSEYLADDSVRPGDNLLMVAFGGGLTWGAAVVRWLAVPAVIAARRPSVRYERNPGRGIPPATQGEHLAACG